MFPLRSSRLLLRRFTSSDLKPFLAYRNDPEVARYQSWESFSPPTAMAFIERQQTQPPAVPGEWLQFAIALSKTDELIGDCGMCVHADEVRQATVGITLARAYQGLGYATEALSTLLDFLFAKLHLHRVQADTDPQNQPAWSLLEGLGMRREGHLRQGLWFKDGWADVYLYAILRSEWNARGDAK